MDHHPTRDQHEAIEPGENELTVGELIDLLAEHDPDTPVRLATQPAWAFAYTLAPLAAADEQDGVVWLAEGAQLSYLPTAARHALAEAGDPRWTCHA